MQTTTGLLGDTQLPSSSTRQSWRWSLSAHGEAPGRNLVGPTFWTSCSCYLLPIASRASEFFRLSTIKMTSLRFMKSGREIQIEVCRYKNLNQEQAMSNLFSLSSSSWRPLTEGVFGSIIIISSVFGQKKKGREFFTQQWILPGWWWSKIWEIQIKTCRLIFVI